MSKPEKPARIDPSKMVELRDTPRHDHPETIPLLGLAGFVLSVLALTLAMIAILARLQ